MKKTVTILLAALMMLGFASCLDRNRMDDGFRDNTDNGLRDNTDNGLRDNTDNGLRDNTDNGFRYDYNGEYPFNASVPGEISMVDFL